MFERVGEKSFENWQNEEIQQNRMQYENFQRNTQRSVNVCIIKLFQNISQKVNWTSPLNIDFTLPFEVFHLNFIFLFVGRKWKCTLTSHVNFIHYYRLSTVFRSCSSTELTPYSFLTWTQKCSFSPLTPFSNEMEENIGYLHVTWEASRAIEGEICAQYKRQSTFEFAIMFWRWILNYFHAALLLLLM